MKQQYATVDLAARAYRWVLVRMPGTSAAFARTLKQIEGLRNPLPIGGRIEPDIGVRNEIETVPRRGRCVAVLPFDAGQAVTIERGGAVRLPGWTRIDADIVAGLHIQAVDQQGRRQVASLQQNAGPV